MAKEKWTCKKVRQYNAISISYCGAWYLLRGLEPIAYTAGIYGWNEDIYYVGNNNHTNTFITTGYRPHGTKHVSYDILESYEEQAKIIYNSKEDYKTKIAMISALRAEFLEKVA